MIIFNQSTRFPLCIKYQLSKQYKLLQRGTSRAYDERSSTLYPNRSRSETPSSDK